MLKGPGRTHRMNTRNKAPHPLQCFRIIQLRRAPAAARRQRKLEAPVFVQRTAIEHQRRHHWQLARREFRGKIMLFLNRRTAPSLRPVELGDDRHALLQPHLVNTVFVTVQRLQPAIAAQAAAGFDGIEDGFGVQCGIGFHGAHCSSFGDTNRSRSAFRLGR